MDVNDNGPLACPRCRISYPAEERFCSNCGMPLTYSGEVDAEQSGNDLQRRARKIKPQYARGELRKVAFAHHQPEAEFIQTLLLEEGVPSTLRRTTWDVPEMLPAGPRAVMVPESGYARALEALDKSEVDVIAEQRRARESRPSPWVLLVVILVGAGVIAVALLIAKAVL